MAAESMLILFILMIAGATGLQAVLFAAVAAWLATRWPKRGLGYLAALLLIIALSKSEQLSQMLAISGGATRFSLVVAPLQMLITPLLFFYLRGLAVPHRLLRWADSVHLLPAIGVAVFLLAALGAADGRLEPVLQSSTNQHLIPIVGDMLQLGYILAIFVTLRRHGIALRSWYAHVEGRSLFGFGFLMAGWAAIVLLHMFFVAGPDRMQQPIFLALNLLHWLFVNLLALFALRHAGDPEPPEPIERYRASQQSDEERAALFARANAHIVEQSLFRDTDLTLASLADTLAATPREMSEAINGAGGQSFFEFVNRHRIESAKAELIAKPEARIIDIAIDNGFNSKSAFNNAFRRYAGLSPTAFRRESLG